ncbi:neuronal acetylcholine receptor subunit alpha-6-like [Argopecten irradians]|uniref:neuronal acetylcholine receptor subunit alpha-6-like n=1 Tax=Argopecten irradians TaxID=31199 RepID=UPI003720B584
MDSKIYTTVLLLTYFQVADLTVSTVQKDIYNAIMTGYTKEVHPYTTAGTPLHIYAQAFLLSINDFDEVSGILEIVIILGLQWEDEALAWDLVNHSYKGVIVIPQKQIWTPELYNVKAADTFEAIGGGNFKVTVIYSGEVHMYPGGILKVKCSPDVAKFPFDVQTCSLELLPWMYTFTDTVITASVSQLDMTYYEMNGEWTVLETSISSGIKGDYSVIVITIKMERLPLYHLVNTVVPLYFLGFLNPLVFILPCDCGERSGYTLTMLLSYTVFMMVINSALPQTSSPMAVLSFVTFGALVFSGFIAVINCFQLRMFHRDESVPVPAWLVKLVKMLSCSRRGRVKPDEDINVQNEETSSPSSTVTWKKVVDVLDMVYLTAIYVTGIVGTIVGLLYLTSG